MFFMFFVSGMIIAHALVFYFEDEIKKILQKYPEMNPVFVTLGFMFLAVAVFVFFVMGLISGVTSS